MFLADRTKTNIEIFVDFTLYAMFCIYFYTVIKLTNLKTLNCEIFLSLGCLQFAYTRHSLMSIIVCRKRPDKKKKRLLIHDNQVNTDITFPGIKLREFNKSIIKLLKLSLLAAIQFETLKLRHFFFFLTDD